jgi:Cdc6-like AAA superfamily ATPase
MPNPENLLPAWEKGQTGNPNGRPKGRLNLSTIIAQRLEEGDKAVKLADRLIKIATDDNSRDNDALSAIGEILDRMEGKATQKVEDVTQQPKQLVIVRQAEK